MINKFWKITNIFKHIRMNLMVIGASGPKTGRILKNTSLAVQEALTHCLQNPQNGRWVWKEVQLQVIGSSDHLSQNEFFDWFIPSMRTSKIQIAPSWPQNSRQGLERGVHFSWWQLPPSRIFFIVQTTGLDINLTLMEVNHQQVPPNWHLYHWDSY